MLCRCSWDLQGPPPWGNTVTPSFCAALSPQTVLRIVVLGIWDYIENKIEVKTRVRPEAPRVLGDIAVPGGQPVEGAAPSTRAQPQRGVEVGGCPARP